MRAIFHTGNIEITDEVIEVLENAAEGLRRGGETDADLDASRLIYKLLCALESAGVNEAEGRA